MATPVSLDSLLSKTPELEVIADPSWCGLGKMACAQEELRPLSFVTAVDEGEQLHLYCLQLNHLCKCVWVSVCNLLLGGGRVGNPNCSWWEDLSLNSPEALSGGGA